MALWRLTLVALLAVVLSGCSLGKAPEVYPMSGHTLRAKLAGSEFPLAMLTQDFEASTMAAMRSDGSLSWLVKSGSGQSIVRILVIIGDVEGGATFDIAVTGTNTLIENRLAQSPSFRSKIVEIAREHCDAVLNERPFDEAHARAQILPPNAEEDRRVVHEINAAGDRIQRREAANMDRAYREEGGRNPWN